MQAKMAGAPAKMETHRSPWLLTFTPSHQLQSKALGCSYRLHLVSYVLHSCIAKVITLFTWPATGDTLAGEMETHRSPWLLTFTPSHQLQSKALGCSYRLHLVLCSALLYCKSYNTFHLASHWRHLGW